MATGPAGPAPSFRGNNIAELRGAPYPGRAEANAPLRREIRTSIAPANGSFAIGKAYSFRDTAGQPHVDQRIDGKSVTSVDLVVTLTNTGDKAQCNIRVGVTLLDAKGAKIEGAILPGPALVGAVGGFKVDPAAMTVVGAGPGLHLNDDCLERGASGYVLAHGNLPVAPFDNLASVELSVDTFNGEPPPLVWPKAKVLPVDYAYEPDPAHRLTIGVKNSGSAAADVKSVRYVVLDDGGEPLLSGWTWPVAAGKAAGAPAVRLAPGASLQTNDDAGSLVGYQGRGGTRMLAWVEFVDAK